MDSGHGQMAPASRLQNTATLVAMTGLQMSLTSTEGLPWWLTDDSWTHHTQCPLQRLWPLDQTQRLRFSNILLVTRCCVAMCTVKALAR